MEKFIIIEQFGNYAVSNYGRLKNVKNGKILTQFKNRNGYMSYTFCQNRIKKTFRVHRLVALYFVDNPDAKPYVNHKDGDKTNNKATNLEWCTVQENQIHARSTGLINQEKPVKATNVLTGEEISFKSVSEAGAFLGINKGTICKVLSGKRNKTHDYSFTYI